jgi:N-acyl homoserine lactone hydrolase
VPSINFNKEQTLASMQKISDTMTKEKAQFWINHDKPQRDSLKLSPAFYD